MDMYSRLYRSQILKMYSIPYFFFRSLRDFFSFFHVHVPFSHFHFRIPKDPSFQRTCLLAKIGADTAENEPLNVFNSLNSPPQVTSHNAVLDNATVEQWDRLAALAGREVWASENPRPWLVRDALGRSIGVEA